jgi:hypothetical protein
VIEILGVGLILGLFATKYQKRKEVEYGLQGEIVKNRIKAYQRIIRSISGIYNSIAPSSALMEQYDEVMDGMPFVMPASEYPSYMNSEQEFDSYYRDLSHLCSEEHIFLDSNVEYRISEYLDYLTEIKMMLDAYSDMENSRTDIDKGKSEELINFAYQTFGLALVNDFGRFYSVIDNVIAREVSTMTLGFRNKRLKIMIYNLRTKIASRMIGLCNSKKKIIKVIAGYIYSLFLSRLSNSTLARYPDCLIVLLMRIHYSTNYSVEQFDSLSDGEREQLIRDFYAGYISLYHVE